MPSPLNGFTAPAASPISSMPGTTWGTRFRLIGSGPDSTRPSAVSSEISHSGGSIVENALNSRCAEICLKSLNVLSRPAPRLICPPATGNSQP